MSKAGGDRPAQVESGLAGRLLAAEPGDVGLALEAALALGLVRAALAVVSLSSVTAFAGDLAVAARAGSPRRLAGADEEAGVARRLAKAVDSASGRLGGRCLLRSLALQAMLARRGVASVVVVAVRSRGGPLPGHAWVEVNGAPLGADGRAAASDLRAEMEPLGRLGAGTAAEPG